MKKVFFILVNIIFLGCSLNAQSTDPNGLWYSSNGSAMKVAFRTENTNMVYKNLDNGGVFEAVFIGTNNDGNVLFKLVYADTYIFIMESFDKITVFNQTQNQISSIWTRTPSNLTNNNLNSGNYNSNNQQRNNRSNTAPLENEIRMIESQLSQAESDYKRTGSAATLQQIHALRERLTRTQQNLYKLQNQR